jgi:hypothetical protein
MDVKTLFNLIKSKSKKLNENDPKFNGLKFWHSLKGHLSESKFVAKGWKKENKSTIDNVMNMPEYIINGKDEKIILEKNHFLIQTVRIPLLDKPILRKIMQVALNIGQFQGKGGKSKYLSGRTKITDYISKKESEIKLEKILPKGSIKMLLQNLQ